VTETKKHTDAASEIARGERFAFGRNWRGFLEDVDEARIQAAERSLRRLFVRGNFSDETFLDVGCGSGLFSLAAWRLGARVRSFDFDADSVACARELRERFAGGDTSRWTLGHGSILDGEFMAGLGGFDRVYAWGVLHHTGDLWGALENVLAPLAPGGSLCVALYNDQGLRSDLWWAIKRAYCASLPGRAVISATFVPGFLAAYAAVDLLRGQSPLRRHREHRAWRGMSVTRDIVDWLGGYPFQVASAEEVVDFFRVRGLELLDLEACGGSSGNNEFVFARPEPADNPG
jgi:SAM-dependent methyltransferase